MTDPRRPFRDAKCGKWTAEPSAPDSVIEDLCKEPVLYIEHESGSRSKYRESDVRDLRALLDDALADALPAPPPDDDLVPILDAVRERKLPIALEMIVEVAVAADDELTLAMLHALADARDAKRPIPKLHDGLRIAAQQVVLDLARTTDARQSDVCVSTGLDWRAASDVVRDMVDRGLIVISPESYIRLAPATIAQVVAVQPEPAPSPRVGGNANHRQARREGRRAQGTARASGRNCQSCDGGYVQVQTYSGIHLRTCRYCQGTGVRDPG